MQTNFTEFNTGDPIRLASEGSERVYNEREREKKTVEMLEYHWQVDRAVLET